MNGEVQAIDWGAPIEAVHEDGTVVPLTLQSVKEFGGTNPDRMGDIWTQSIPPFPGDVMCWAAPHFRRGPWTIRNVATPPQTPDVPPEVVEQLRDLLMQAQFLSCNHGGDCERNPLGVINKIHSIADKALALMEPVDPIEAIAARLIEQKDEPWPCGTESDRLHYWRDKAIKAANELRSLSAGGAQ